MTTPYIDLHDIAQIEFGSIVPSTWFATARDNMETLARAPGCVVQRTALQALASNTPTPVEFTAADIRDTDGFHSPTSEPSKLVVPPGLGGWYSLLGSIGLSSSQAGRRILRWRVNGSVDADVVTWNPDPVSSTSGQVHGELLLNAGDYVELLIQTSSPAINITSSRAAMRLVALA